MTKTLISKIWMLGLWVLIAGLLVGGLSLGFLFAYGGRFVPAANGNGSDFLPKVDGFFWTMVSFIIVGFVAATAGGIAQIAAWIGAVLNTYRLPDKTWFTVLLTAGGFGLIGLPLVGFAAMLAYLIGGPDGMASESFQAPSQPASITPLAS